MSKLPVSVIILTLNESFHIADAIDNVREWARDVFVLDSCSTDATVDIALERGAKVAQRKFTNFGDQWNFALDRLPVETPWTLKLDADERLSEPLKDEIARLLSGRPEHAGYEMRRRLWFMGKPLSASQWIVRLWQTGKCRFSDVLVNEQPLVEGNVGRLDGFMNHFDSRDLHHWYEKQNRYSTMEAIIRAEGRSLAMRPRLFGNSHERRMFFKKAFYRAPLRYQLLYWYHLIGFGVWRDGRVGRAWARLRTELYRSIELKELEIRWTGGAPEVPRAPGGEVDPRVADSDLQRVVMGDGESKRDI